MNTAALRRKLLYVACIVAILIPLYILGQPPVQRDNQLTSAGGVLSQIRKRYDLGQSDLGKLDPASESARLATLGLRGVATSIMWSKAQQYKVDMNWDRLSAALNQIALLQPHYIKVWEFQAHNLSYNISVEFDDYRQRYNWVKKGIDFLVRGTEYNRRDANLPWFLGFIYGQKIGRSDERKQFRELFRNDTEFHNEIIADGIDVNQEDSLGPDRKPDNWLVGRLWYNRGAEIIDSGTLMANGMRKSPVQFFSSAPMSVINYCEAIEGEGILDERARFAWQRSQNDWMDYGRREMPSTFGHTLRLNDLAESNERLQKYEKAFKDFLGDVYDKVITDRKNSLTKEQQEALAVPEQERSEQQIILAREAMTKINPTFREIAREAPPEKRIEALRLATLAEKEIEYREHVDIYRNQVNYNYWEVRCKAEQEDDALAARRFLFDAEKQLDDAELDTAITNYDEAWKRWASLFRKYPLLMIDEDADNVMDAIGRYQRMLDAELPDNFPLRAFLEFRNKYEQGGPDFNLQQEMAQAAMGGDLIDPMELLEKHKDDGLPPTPFPMKKDKDESQKPAEATQEPAAAPAPVEAKTTNSSGLESPEQGEPPAPTPE